MENESEKLDHQVAGLPSLCLASSRILFSVHTGDSFGENTPLRAVCTENQILQYW